MRRLLSLFLIGALIFSAPLPSAYAGITSATGGTITTVGSDKVHTFTSSGTFTPTGSGTVVVLVVGGGGGGGCEQAGGGGGGGVVYNSSKAVTGGTGYTVTIGGGGNGATTDGEGANGVNSVFGDITAYGGGGGGGGYSHDPGDGGCGGGGAGQASAPAITGGTASQGYAGGNGYSGHSGGGGGGAGQVGSTAADTVLGNGGNGYQSAISGTNTYYAGGGGGGGSNSPTPGYSTAGLGGGGIGYNASGSGINGTNGTANTGGGGGGGSGWHGHGGNGGSGIVIVRYTPVPAAPTNVAATDGTYTDKVTVTWTKSTGATGYKVYEGSNLLDTLGDVATYDDTAAPAPTITAGSTVASDGTQLAHVALSLSGTSTSNGASRTYKVVATSSGGDSADSSTDTGYRGVGSLTYQWQMSAGNSDASYSNLDGATSSTYNATEAPADGSGRYFKCVLDATGAIQQTSTADRGYRKVGGYQLIIVGD